MSPMIGTTPTIASQPIFRPAISNSASSSFASRWTFARSAFSSSSTRRTTFTGIATLMLMRLIRFGPRPGALETGAAFLREDFFDPPERFLFELDAARFDVLLDLARPGGADDATGDLRAAEVPGERELREREVVLIGDRDKTLDLGQQFFVAEQ